MFQHLFEPLPTASEKQKWDEACTNSFAIPSILLMENASREAFLVIRKNINLTPQTKILIFMGAGNNGGDGVALARHLHNAGCQVLVLCLAEPEKLTETSKAHLEMARKITTPILFCEKDQHTINLPHGWDSPDIIIDAICGVGVKGVLRQREQDLVAFINSKQHKSFIVSLDIPTGLCPQTGKALPLAVQANLTISFEAAQAGLFFPESRQFSGKIVVCPIGMPKSLAQTLPASWLLLSPKAGKWAEPTNFLHKGRAGKTLVIGGSLGMDGAPFLAALASLRTGCGTVHLAIPKSLCQGINQHWPEIQVTPVGKSDCWTKKDATEIIDLVEQLAPTAIVIGPGLGRSPETKAFLEAFLKVPRPCPTVIDADALWHLGHKNRKDYSEIFNLLDPLDILTPHPGEIAELLPNAFFEENAEKNDLDENKILATKFKKSTGLAKKLDKITREEKIQIIQKNRGLAIQNLSTLCPACIVLKGAGTLIKQQKSPTVLCPIAVASLAVGGSGDVLSGVIAALAGMGISPLNAASLGVHLHCQAGLVLTKTSLRGHLAQEIANSIPIAFASLYTNP